MAVSLPSLRTQTRVILTSTAVAIGLVLGLWYARHLVLLTFFAGVLAVGFDGIARVIARRFHFGRVLSLSLTFLAVASATGLAMWFLAFEIAGQVRELAVRLPEALERITAWAARTPWAQDLMEQSRDVQTWVTKQRELVSGAGKFLSTTAGFFSGAALSLVLALFLVANPKPYVQGFLRLVSPHRRPRMSEFLSESGHVLRRWLLGKAVTMTAVGLMSGTGLSLLGVQPALALGLLSGLFTFVPFLGPIVATVPAVVLGLSQGLQQGIAVLALYVGIQIIEGNLLEPLVERKAVWLPPALTILAQLLMGAFFGFPGILVASPLTAVALLAVRMLYVEDVVEAGRAGEEELEMPEVDRRAS